MRCNNLKTIIVHENNPVFYATECCLINKDEMSLVVGFNVNNGNVLIPDGVKVISHSAFYGRNTIKKVILSESVEKIEYSAFAECLNLEYVYLNDNLKSLEGFTFNNCINLKEIIMPSTIENIKFTNIDGILIDTTSTTASYDTKIEYISWINSSRNILQSMGHLILH